MLPKPDKLPSLTTSYWPISLISSIMKLFERVIKQRLRFHLEHIGFINKHQSGFRKAKSTDDHLFRQSQSIMESFNRGEHVVAAFLTSKNLMTMFGTIDSGIKFFSWIFPLKWRAGSLTSWLAGSYKSTWTISYPTKSIPRQGYHRVLSWVHYFSVIYVNDLPKPDHKENSLSQFADDTAQWAFRLNMHIAAKRLQQDLPKLAMWCSKWRIRLYPVKPKVIIFSRSILARKTEINLKLYGETLKIHPQVKFLGIIFDSQLNFRKHFEDILNRCNTRYHSLRLLVFKKWGPSPSHLNPNLYTMRPSNFWIRLSFDY